VEATLAATLAHTLQLGPGLARSWKKSQPACSNLVPVGRESGGSRADSQTVPCKSHDSLR
jgi:hypothetical protein